MYYFIKDYSKPNTQHKTLKPITQSTQSYFYYFKKCAYILGLNSRKKAIKKTVSLLQTDFITRELSFKKRIVLKFICFTLKFL